jgi:cullin-4
LAAHRGCFAIDLEDLKRTVQSLALGKKRVLMKRPAGKDIDDDDEVFFNKNFEDKNHNVRINTIQVQETVRQIILRAVLSRSTWLQAEETKATEKEIDRDRDYITDAAIVRIMKASKKKSHEELLVETIKAVERSFKLQPKFLKQRVDVLIGDEYMTRDEDDLNLYHYVA